MLVWVSRKRRYLANLVFVAAVVSALCACVTTSYHAQQKGVVVADFYADVVGSVLVLVNKNAPAQAVAVIEITPLDNFRVLELPAGDYAWLELREPNRRTPLLGQFDISVKPNVINYIGSMLIKSYKDGPRISLVNQATEVEQRLDEDYATLSQRYPFVLNLTRQHH